LGVCGKRLKIFFTKEWTKDNIMEEILEFEYKPEKSLALGSNVNWEEASVNLDYCINLKVKIDPNKFMFVHPIGPSLDMAIRIIPEIGIGVCLSIGFNGEYKKGKKNDYSFNIECYGKSEISLSLDCGVYYPGAKSKYRISLNLGIKGIIGSGRAGVKLIFFLNRDKYRIDFYYDLIAFQFNLYLMMQISYKMKFINLEIDIEIINLLLFGFRYEYHFIRDSNYKSNIVGYTRQKTKRGDIFKYFQYNLPFLKGDVDD